MSMPIQQTRTVMRSYDLPSLKIVCRSTYFARQNTKNALTTHKMYVSFLCLYLELDFEGNYLTIPSIYAWG